MAEIADLIPFSRKKWINQLENSKSLQKFSSWQKEISCDFVFFFIFGFLVRAFAIESERFVFKITVLSFLN